MSLFLIVAGNLAGKIWGRKFTRQSWRFSAKIWRFWSFGTWSHCAPTETQNTHLFFTENFYRSNSPLKSQEIHPINMDKGAGENRKGLYKNKGKDTEVKH